jgi:hypothetical protein
MTSSFYRATWDLFGLYSFSRLSQFQEEQNYLLYPLLCSVLFV